MTEAKFAPGSKEVVDYFKGALQRHHDYYVGLEKMGKLTDIDRPNYEAAMKREKAGEVKPLIVEPTSKPGEQEAKK